MIEVELPPFKDTVNAPFADLYDNKNRLILLWGGRGSGKTHAAVLKIIYMMLTASYFKGILIRKVYDTIKESQYDSIKQTIEDLGLSSLFEFKVSPLSIRCINGNRLIARGLDKAEKIKSIKDPSFVWYEEGNEITEDDFNTVSTTVRSTKAEYLQEIFSFNPESDEPDFSDFWIYARFFSHTNEKTFTTAVEVETPDGPIEYSFTSIHSTYQDNTHLPASISATYEDFKRTSPYYYSVYTLGMWGNKEVGARFYKNFTLDLVKHVEYSPELPLHISLDENVNPFLTMTVHQVETIGEVVEVRQLTEICLKSPRNTLRETCNEFSRIFKNHTETVFIYGDATSKKQDTKLQKGENFFTLAANYLIKYRPVLRLPSRNPPVKSRGEFINEMFDGKIENARFVLGDSCSNSIADYLYLKEGADGLKHKEKTTDKLSGVRFEKYGHCFVKGTLVRTEYGNKKIEDIKIGDLVHTRDGLKPVLRSGITRRNARVQRYEIDGKVIICTPDHKIYTKNKGFKEVDSLTGTNTFCIFDSWTEKQKSIRGENFTGTQELKTRQIGGILKDGQRKVKRLIYTALYMSARLAQYLKTSIFTTSTATTTTTAPRILNPSQHQTTISTIGTKKQRPKKSNTKTTSTKKQGQRLKSGTQARRGASGTLSTPRTFSTKIKRLSFARSAEQKRKAEAPQLNFVASSVKTDSMHGYTADVYDITVKDKHEFFANDILVHNCSDANDYLFLMLFSPQFAKFMSGGIIKKPIFGKRKNSKRF
jgi:hypothetical protein